MPEITTKLGMIVNPEKEEDMINMILHDSFIIELASDMVIRCLRVYNGMLYVLKSGHSTLVPFN